jgi:hypothetical protein
VEHIFIFDQRTRCVVALPPAHSPQQAPLEAATPVQHASRAFTKLSSAQRAQRVSAQASTQARHTSLHRTHRQRSGQAAHASPPRSVIGQASKRGGSARPSSRAPRVNWQRSATDGMHLPDLLRHHCMDTMDRQPPRGSGVIEVARLAPGQSADAELREGRRGDVFASVATRLAALHKARRRWASTCRVAASETTVSSSQGPMQDNACIESNVAPAQTVVYVRAVCAASGAQLCERAVLATGLRRARLLIRRGSEAQSGNNGPASHGAVSEDQPAHLLTCSGASTGQAKQFCSQDSDVYPAAHHRQTAASTGNLTLMVCIHADVQHWSHNCCHAVQGNFLLALRCASSLHCKEMCVDFAPYCKLPISQLSQQQFVICSVCTFQAHEEEESGFSIRSGKPSHSRPMHQNAARSDPLCATGSAGAPASALSVGSGDASLGVRSVSQMSSHGTEGSSLTLLSRRSPRSTLVLGSSTLYVPALQADPTSCAPHRRNAGNVVAAVHACWVREENLQKPATCNPPQSIAPLAVCQVAEHACSMEGAELLSAWNTRVAPATAGPGAGVHAVLTERQTGALSWLDVPAHESTASSNRGKRDTYLSQKACKELEMVLAPLLPQVYCGATLACDTGAQFHTEVAAMTSMRRPTSLQQPFPVRHVPANAMLATL